MSYETEKCFRRKMFYEIFSVKMQKLEYQRRESSKGFENGNGRKFTFRPACSVFERMVLEAAVVQEMYNPGLGERRRCFCSKMDELISLQLGCSRLSRLQTDSRNN